MQEWRGDDRPPELPASSHSLHGPGITLHINFILFNSGYPPCIGAGVWVGTGVGGGLGARVGDGVGAEVETGVRSGVGPWVGPWVGALVGPRKRENGPVVRQTLDPKSKL